MRRPCATRIRQPLGVRVGEDGGAVGVRGVNVEGGWGCCGCEWG